MIAQSKAKVLRYRGRDKNLVCGSDSSHTAMISDVAQVYPKLYWDSRIRTNRLIRQGVAALQTYSEP